MLKSDLGISQEVILQAGSRPLSKPDHHHTSTVCPPRPGMSLSYQEIIECRYIGLFSISKSISYRTSNIEYLDILKTSDFFSFFAENSPKIQKIPRKFRKPINQSPQQQRRKFQKFAENSENSPKILKIRRKFAENSENSENSPKIPQKEGLL